MLSRNIKEDVFYLALWVAMIVASWFALDRLEISLDRTVAATLCASVATFLLYGLDKFFAGARMWRVSERVLLFTALLLGSAGAVVGMYFFRHKTRKSSFQLLLFLIVFVQILWIVYRQGFLF